MALKEDYLDDILDTSANEKRKYRMINNADGTISLEDVTDYSQNGDEFGAYDVNAITKTINALTAIGITVRYNQEHGYLEVLVDGEWQKTEVDTGVLTLNIYTSGNQLVPLDTTNYTFMQYEILQPNILDNVIEIPLYNYTGTPKAIMIGTENKVDLTNYSSFNIEFTVGSTHLGEHIYKMTGDITAVIGEFYVSIASFPNGVPEKAVRLSVTSTKDVANDNNMISLTQGCYEYEPLYIKRIWLE